MTFDKIIRNRHKRTQRDFLLVFYFSKMTQSKDQNSADSGGLFMLSSPASPPHRVRCVVMFAIQPAAYLLQCCIWARWVCCLRSYIVLPVTVRQHQIWPKENLQHLHSDHKVLYRRTNRLKGGPTWSYSNPEPSHCDAVITPCHPATIIKRQRNKRKMKECKTTQQILEG